MMLTTAPPYALMFGPGTVSAMFAIADVRPLAETFGDGADSAEAPQIAPVASTNSVGTGAVRATFTPPKAESVGLGIVTLRLL